MANDFPPGPGHRPFPPGSTPSTETDHALGDIGRFGVEPDIINTITGLIEALAPSLSIQMPLGGICMWALTTAPTGFLLCDGQTTIKDDAYPEFFAYMKTTDVSIGSDFTIPDLRGRVPVGVGPHADVATILTYDALVEADRTPNLPLTHKHSAGSLNAASPADSRKNALADGMDVASGSHGHSVTGHTADEALIGAIPHLVLNFIMRVR